MKPMKFYEWSYIYDVLSSCKTLSHVKVVVEWVERICEKKKINVYEYRFFENKVLELNERLTDVISI